MAEANLTLKVGTIDNNSAWITDGTAATSESKIINRLCATSPSYHTSSLKNYRGMVKFSSDTTLPSGWTKYFILTFTAYQSRPEKSRAIFNSTKNAYDGDTYAATANIPSYTDTNLPYSNAYKSSALESFPNKDNYVEGGQTVYYKINLTDVEITENTDYFVYLVCANELAAGCTTKYPCVWGPTRAILADYTIKLEYTPKYNVSASGDAGIKSISGTGDYDQGATATLTATMNSGYSFKSWAGDSTSTSSSISFTNLQGDKTVTASTSLITYDITIDKNGGSGGTSSTTYNVTSNTITLSAPTKTGHTFAGWTGSNGTTPQTTVSIAKGSTGNKSYTANWTANSYIFKIDPNGGYRVSDNSIDVIEVTRTYGTTELVTERRKAGYKLIGYTLKNTDSGSTSDLGGAKISFDASTNTAQFTQGTKAVTAVAQWEALATMYTKASGVWKAGIPFIKVNGTWKRAIRALIKVNGQWKDSTRG